MRFTVYDDAGTAVEQCATYGDATASAREQSARAAPDAVYAVRDHEYGLTLNRFQRGETLQERVHKNAYLAVVAARDADHLRRIVAEYADEVGCPELGRMDYDAAVARAANLPAATEVFQAAAEKSDRLAAP